LEMLPLEIHSRLSGLDAQNVPSEKICEPDATELAMRRTSAELARRILEEELAHGEGLTGHQFCARLEHAYRRAGAEDLIVLISNGDAAPAPPRASVLGAEYSVAVALERRGHWVKVTRPHTTSSAPEAEFKRALAGHGGYRENLAGPYPYRSGPGAIFALHIETASPGGRLSYGDTCAGDRLL